MKELNVSKQNISNIIKEIRLRQGFTLNEVCTRSNVSTSTISRLENGESIPSKKTIEKIINGMGLTWEDFIFILKEQDKKNLNDVLDNHPLLKDSMPKDDFGALVREIREFLGYTRKEAAEELGISAGTLFKIEQKNQEPNPRVFRGIIKMLWEHEKERTNNNIIENKLSNVIDEFLFTIGISYRELAKAAELPYTFIGAIWRNEPDPKTGDLIVPTIDELIKLANGMGITLVELLEKSGYIKKEGT